jgi:hypothetical protein
VHVQLAPVTLDQPAEGRLVTRSRGDDVRVLVDPGHVRALE